VFFGVAALCLAQGGWQTATTLPSVDFSGLTKANRDVALAVLRADKCTCGCDMKIAECRVNDPSCGTSRRYAAFVVKEASEGKTVATIRADFKKFADAPPPVLDPPVKISVDGDPVRGPANAKVTIVEFSDFQCPFCAKATPEVTALLQKFPKDVRVVFKQFPLETHSQAALAAEASLAAQAQGKFWELHDKMYANFRILSEARIMGWAKDIGLDVTRFHADLASHKYKARVDSEEKQGEAAGVEGTPTFFIDGKKFNSVFEAADIAPLIVEELKH
jgi:protein-disulfide isomerase